MHISISKGNTKLGSIQSVSLPAVETCRPCSCHKKCYAHKLERIRPAVRRAYKNNLKVLADDPSVYWREVEAAIMLSRFFRFHVSGDIPDADYFRTMVSVAERNPHCEILCFTKKYEIVNEFLVVDEFLTDGSAIPRNLHIIFSAWVGLDMANPFSLPTAHVRFRDGTTTASEHAIECSGNCSACATVNGGCWTLGPGEEIVFDEH